MKDFFKDLLKASMPLLALFMIIMIANYLTWLVQYLFSVIA